jgi:hypothetical protein
MPNKLLFNDEIVNVNWEKEPVCTVLFNEEDDRLKLIGQYSFVVTSRTGKDVILTEITIEDGFRFEGSVPRFFWRVITPTDPSAWSAYAIHDFCYLLCKKGLCTREQADELLYQAMRKNKIGLFTSLSVYRSVRMFGGVYAKSPLTPLEASELAKAGY